MKVLIVVTDSLGVGAMPDAADYGDKGADTFGHIWKSNGGIHIPNMLNLGWGNIDGVLNGDLAIEEPIGCFGRMAEASKGKDTTTGHWEIAGLKTDVPFKTYPEGFPKEFMDAYEKAIGIECLGNYPASGTQIIEDLGEEHEKTGKPIVYTSADSVFQIAVNVGLFGLDTLYHYCEVAREMLVGEFACGRVIARPYIINAEGKRERTSDRHDYSVTPFGPTILDKIKEAGKTVYAVGKISDIFNGAGVTESVHNKDDMNGVDNTLDALDKDFEGFIFTNLVDFDAKFGHRRDPKGYGENIEKFDARVPEILEHMADDDVLFITADHGNDPTAPGTDHTREYVPVVCYGKKLKQGVNLGTRGSFADLGATVCDLLGVEGTGFGTSFKEEILK
ncbi:MAG: phosphopentomutase [Clostridiales bacterium]|jgi:phosphopentomutase|nr:phosphopentomutase [Clostridiales bacterium]